MKIKVEVEVSDDGVCAHAVSGSACQFADVHYASHAVCNLFRVHLKKIDWDYMMCGQCHAAREQARKGAK